ncbi:MAG: hypothetical protein IJD51_00900 [Clostridia bacterium]|nr:hypothetical protein [Clostridia bacterium]
MKDKVGVIKEIDKLGRIVIPKELRDRYGFTNSVEVVATEAGIILRSPEYKLVKIKASRKSDE